MWGWGQSPGAWMAGALVVLVVLVLLAGVAAAVLVSTRSSRRDPAGILADRFARGEIDEQEYRRRLAVLGRGPADHDLLGGR